MKVAALDLGSNTFLCLICEIQDNQIFDVHSDEVEVVRLGQGLAQNKFFHPDALVRADKCLARFAKSIQSHQVVHVKAVATAAARDASNAESLFAIGAKYNIPIEIVAGSKEAEITYAGAISGLENQSSVAVIDIGGGSTELIFGRNGKILNSQSVNVGCVKIKETILHQNFRLDEAKQKVDELTPLFADITSKIRSENPSELVAVAGTPTTIAACELGGFDAKKIDGYVLSRERLEFWAEEFSNVSPTEISKKWPVDPGRADVILSGALLLLLNLRLLGLDKLTVSTRGVRYGVALKMF